MTKTTAYTKAVSTASALAILTAGFASATIAPAVAQDGEAPVAVEATKGPLATTFPADGTSTLNIHKRANPAETHPASDKGAAEDGNVPGTPAGKGYTFTLQKVADGNQLKDQETFNALAKLTHEQSRGIAERINADKTLKSKNISAPTGNADFTLETDDQGVATQANIPNGAYLVTETASPEGVTSQVHPFLVFLPQPDPTVDAAIPAAEGDWNNDVHVYPKNGKTNITKEVVDSNKNVGDTVEYTLSATVPSSAQGETLEKFSLVDMFNSDELGEFNLVETTVESGGSSKTITANQGEATALDKATEDGSNTSITYDVPVDGLKGGDVVTVKVNAKLLDTRKDSEIINEAKTVVRHSGDDSDKETTPVDVRTYVGDIELLKFNDKNEDGKKSEGEEALKGATFELYRDKAAAEKRAKDTSGEATDAVKTITTGDDGKARFTGLHVTDFENNEGVDAGKLNYYLVETKAPDGFAIPNADKNVHEITLTRADHNTANEGSPVILVNDQSEIPNVPSERFMPELPVTGEQGVLILGGAALVLLAGAGIFASRKNKQEA